MIERAKNLLKNEALQNTIIVSGGVFLGSIFAYFVQIFLGRNLTVEDYGIFNALLSVGVVIGVLNSTLTTSIIKTVSSLKAQNESTKLARLFVHISFGALILGFIVFFALALLKVPLASFLNIDDASIFLDFGLYLGVSFIVLIPLAYFQGLLKFRTYAGVVVLNSVIKFTVVAIALSIGFGVGGVFRAMSLGGVIAYILYILLLREDLSDFDPSVRLGEHYRKILLFAGPVLLVQFGIILLNNIDIVLVKHYFDGHTAGLYSGLVTVAKVFLFAANTVAVVMFPQISASFAAGKDYSRKFKAFFYIQIVVIILGIIIFTLIPRFIVLTMFGENYLEVVPHLPKFVLFFGFYVYINFMTLFLLAIEKTKVYLLQLPAVLLQTVFIMLFHNSIAEIIYINIGISFVLALFVSIYAYHCAKNYKAKIN